MHVVVQVDCWWFGLTFHYPLLENQLLELHSGKDLAVVWGAWVEAVGAMSSCQLPRWQLFAQVRQDRLRGLARERFKFELFIWFLIQLTENYRYSNPLYLPPIEIYTIFIPSSGFVETNILVNFRMSWHTGRKQRVICPIAGLIGMIISHAACHLIKLYLRHILRLPNVPWLIIEKVLTLYDSLHLLHIGCCTVMRIQLPSILQVSVPTSSVLL